MAFLTPVEAAFGRPAIVYVMDAAAAQYQAAKFSWASSSFRWR
jgi:hypothetical protein